MTESVPAARDADTQDGYERLEQSVSAQVAGLKEPGFTTDADPDALWEDYLGAMAKSASGRRHFSCQTCRKFVRKFGGLATIDEAGDARPAIWNPAALAGERDPAAAAIAALNARVARAKVTGVFLCDALTWGDPLTEDRKRNIYWTHLGGVPSKPFAHSLMTAGQAMADKREDFTNLSRGLADYPVAAVVQALKVLKAEALYRAEKTLGVAEWLMERHFALAGAKGARRANLLWKAVALAPPGFCHVRGTMISTLLDDVIAGLPFSAIAKRWADKMHPLQYQRPSAPPKAGAIERAEVVVARLGIENSLKRRFATLDDVLAKVWMPREGEAEPAKVAGGVFARLRGAERAVKSVDLPSTRFTWEKFRAAALPTALELELLLPDRGSYYGLLTAAESESPPIIQWDGLAGHPRNPASSYVYHNGSEAERWGLRSGSWGRVTAVFLPPHQWQDPSRFAHHGHSVYFALAGARDSQQRGVGHSCLFPEILRHELHEVRSVIEAHSKGDSVTGVENGDANGYSWHSSGPEVTLRVRSPDGVATCVIDRWS